MHDKASTTGRAGRLHGQVSVRREHDLFVAYAEPERRWQETIRARLVSERFCPDDAIEWACRDWLTWLPRPLHPRDDEDPSSLCEPVIQAALSYRDTGIPSDEAFAWTIRSIGATYAVYLRRQGWNPVTFGNLAGLCIERGPDTDEVDEWVASGIPGWRALRYLEAGLSPAEAGAFEERRLSGEDVDAAIDVLIGLLGSDAE